MRQTDLPHFLFEFSQLGLDAQKVAHTMKHDPENPAGPFSAIIDEVLAEVPQHAQIQGGYRVYSDVRFDRENYTISFGGNEFQTKRIVFNQLRKSDSLAVFVCTAGQVGEWGAELMDKGDLLKGYVADVVGSETVEAAIELIQNQLQFEMQKVGLDITNRFSPGYCGWSVAEQHALFSGFPKGFCGITLRESGLMSPIKSVSGFIGIGSSVRRRPYTCNICDDEHCLYRKSSDVC